MAAIFVESTHFSRYLCLCLRSSFLSESSFFYIPWTRISFSALDKRGFPFVFGVIATFVDSDDDLTHFSIIDSFSRANFVFTPRQFSTGSAFRMTEISTRCFVSLLFISVSGIYFLWFLYLRRYLCNAKKQISVARFTIDCVMCVWFLAFHFRCLFFWLLGGFLALCGLISRGIRA